MTKVTLWRAITQPLCHASTWPQGQTGAKNKATKANSLPHGQREQNRSSHRAALSVLFLDVLGKETRVETMYTKELPRGETKQNKPL